MNCSKCSQNVPFLFHCLNHKMLLCTCCVRTCDKHFISLLCEECENSAAVQYCDNCQQNLCSSCSNRIHNKGKRAKHQTVQISADQIKVKAIIYFMSGRRKPPKIQRFLEFPFFDEKYLARQLKFFSEVDMSGAQLFCDLNLFLANFSVNLQRKYPFLKRFYLVDCQSDYRKIDPRREPLAQSFYVRLGDTQVQIQPLIRYIKGQIFQESIQSRSMNCNQPQYSGSTISQIPYQQKTRIDQHDRKDHKKFIFPIFQNFKLVGNSKCTEIQRVMFDHAEQGTLLVPIQSIPNAHMGVSTGILRVIKRQVGKQMRQMVSLGLEYLSLQSLVWTIMSVREDRITPHQKLIINRIKQCFNLKITNGVWENVINYLKSPRYFTQIEKCPITAKILPKIIVKKSNDSSIEDSRLIFLQKQWLCEDQGKVDTHDPLWKQFVSFLDNYFSDGDKLKNIPGGRYGCVQFVKNCSTAQLATCSLGRLILFVQEAINRGIIRYHRTLIVKNVISEQIEQSSEAPIYSKSFSTIQREIKVKMLQDAFLQILHENPEGVSLAQIPVNLKKKIRFNFNLNDLGFPKLKNFIASVPQPVLIENQKLNYSYAVLTETVRSAHQIEKDNQRSFRLIDQLSTRLKKTLVQVLRKNKMLPVQHLSNALTAQLGCQFDTQIFSCIDFFHFLYYYCQNQVAFETKNSTIYIFARYSYESQNFYKFGVEKGLFDFDNDEEEQVEVVQETSEDDRLQSNFYQILLGQDPQPSQKQTVFIINQPWESHPSTIEMISSIGKNSFHSKTQSLDFEQMETKEVIPGHSRFNSALQSKPKS